MTETQAKYEEAVRLYGSNKKAADALGVGRRTVDKAMRRAKKIVSPKRTGKRFMVLPDVQAKPGIDFSYLRRIGTYMMEKKPEVIVCIGDFADLESLSSWDKGKKSFEGRRYKLDIEASKEAMRALLGPMMDYNERATQLGRKQYRPRMVMTLGNHEHRISRATEDSPQFDGLLSVDALEYKEFGWEVYPFLEVVVIDGVAFSHYFGTGVMGRPASTAAAQLRVANMSCFAGHQQGKQIHYGKRADGSIITSIISGSCYEHNETYLGAQGNCHWRGFWMLNDVNNGAFDEMPVSLSYVNQKYPGVVYHPDKFETITTRFG